MDQWRELEVSMLRAAELDPIGQFRHLYTMHKWSNASYVLRVLNYTIGAMMARGKGKEIPETSSQQNGWTKFVNIPVQGLEWKEVVNLYGSGDQLVDAVSGLCQVGYRFGLSYNPQTDAFICSVTCKDPGSPNSGCTFTSFASTWYEALMLSVYKHFQVAGGDWLSKGGDVQLPMFG